MSIWLLTYLPNAIMEFFKNRCDNGFSSIKHNKIVMIVALFLNNMTNMGNDI